MSLDGAFTALLLLLVSGVSAVIVLPPTNLKVRCQNLKVTVNWKYSELQPQIVFSINMSGSHRKEFNTTDYKYDLSDFIWESESHYMGLYYVTVTAIQEGTRSQPVTSKTFTFNSQKTASITCELYFPPVDLIKKDTMAVISFRNPFNFYGERNLAKKKDSASFHFSVRVSNVKFDSECNLYQEKCTLDILSPDDVKCVALNGSLFDSSGVGRVNITQKKDACITQSTEFHMVTLVIILSVVVVVLVVVTIIICKAELPEDRPCFRDKNRLHFLQVDVDDEAGDGAVDDGAVDEWSPWDDGDVGRRRPWKDGTAGARREKRGPMERGRWTTWRCEPWYDGAVGDGDAEAYSGGSNYLPRTRFGI
ncbi:interferon gamma receptor 1-like [Morone saxatilis]|uniref:interferon gamma receptor 1-like n=1 Tax=Morone saxatilis TaxID=34816 RepID=UPI0015E22EBF|nr:interferon gamma receptor 1-like [Morone saxatilis]